MITTILFDLDGTLLPMDQDVFLKAYMTTLAAKMAQYGYDPKQLINCIWKGTEAMVKNDGSRRNDAVLWDTFSDLMGRNTRIDEPLFDEYYHNEFQNVRHACGFDLNAANTIAEIKDMGYTVALATNPLFPAIATLSRTRWAGLNPDDFAYITMYDNSYHCKPNPDYYWDIMKVLGVHPEECLMVGNDVKEDMIAQTLGMKVFLLTPCLINKENRDISCYPHGGFSELMNYIRGLKTC